MNIAKLTINTKYTPFQNVKNSVVIQAMGYGKIYELLHKQIWRKAPYRITSYANPYYPTHNGRPVRFVSQWNIKSPATGPYVYEGGDYTFGLNQLFMGQDFRKSYVGNPKDGIYHDDCYIQPKSIPVYTGEIQAWCYYDGHDGDGYEIFDSSKYYAENVDINGMDIVTNAVYSTYITTLNNVTKTYHKVTQTNADNSMTIFELGEKTSSDCGVAFNTTSYVIGTLKNYTYGFDLFGHGELLFEQTITSTGFAIYNRGGINGWRKFYTDGTVVQFMPRHSRRAGRDNIIIIPSAYKILPMMYADTGDLTMDMVEFVERWNDYFELIVHEDSEWWQAFVKPIMAIITVVIACYTGIIYNPIGAIGTMLSVAGTLGGNQNLSLIGGVMMAGAGIYNAIEEGYGASLMKSGVFPDRAEVLMQNASFGEMFQGFVSNAGLSNLSQIGSKAFSIGNDISQLGKATIEQNSSFNTNEDEHMKISFSYSEDEEDNDVLGCIKKVIAV